jgi:hypothetical protein
LTPSGSIYTPQGNTRTRQSPLYDSIHIATTTASGLLYKMFGNIDGVGGIGPDITNMQKAFELQGGTSFLVQSMRLCFIAAAADIAGFIRNFTVRLIAGGVRLLDAPADYWPGGGGTSTVAQNGIADPRAVVAFNVDPIRLTDGIAFRVELVGVTAVTTTADFFLRVYLDGQIEEPV